MNTAEKPSGGLTTYLVVYLCILAIAGLQVLLAYQHTEGTQLLARMLGLAVIQAGLGVIFFMHMRQERRSLVLTLIPVTIFVLLMMNMIWSDSYRLLQMRPFPK
jgi:cytochrome c oxidase subunit IV